MGKTLGQKIGQYVKYQRDKRQLSIAAVAAASGLTSAYISRLEQGDYDSPTVDSLQHLAQAFQMPLTALLAKSGVAPVTKIDLPDLAYYLHEKYFLPPEAVADVELFVDTIKKKYAHEIDRYKKDSQKYWRKR